MLGPDFFARPTLEVAPELLGAILFVEGPAGLCSGRIVEVEAYLGAEDLASHAAAGSTPRSAVMFGPPGHTYVYFIYGMHHCLNFVTEQSGKAGAVLIRALEPLSGVELMKIRRKTTEVSNLCSGPGKLCQALAIDRNWNNLPLNLDAPQKIQIAQPDGDWPWTRTTRIGISKSQDLPYRFLAI